MLWYGHVMENKIRVLRVSSDPGERAALRRLLAHTSWQLYEACSVEAAREMFSTQAVDVVLCDECLRDGTWRDVLKDAPGDAETIASAVRRMTGCGPKC